MLGLVVHRVPNDHSVTFSTLREKFSQGFAGRSSSGSESCSEREKPLRKYPDVPIPFLPPPLKYRCPAKIACEGLEEEEEAEDVRVQSESVTDQGRSR